ncbi:hypothetical protein Y032_0259g499 [Ancylostoma ceylanicum]|nr:hypothetical protein Y032_0259g499 [Ancylostoma ceylanicum]
MTCCIVHNVLVQLRLLIHGNGLFANAVSVSGVLRFADLNVYRSATVARTCSRRNGVKPSRTIKNIRYMYSELQMAVDTRWDRGAVFLGRDTRASMQSPCVSA